MVGLFFLFALTEVVSVGTDFKIVKRNGFVSEVSIRCMTCVNSVFMQHAGVYTSSIQWLHSLNPDKRVHHSWFGFS